MRLYEPPYRLMALGIGLPTILYLWGLPLSPIQPVHEAYVHDSAIQGRISAAQLTQLCRDQHIERLYFCGYGYSKLKATALQSFRAAGGSADVFVGEYAKWR